MRLTKFDNLSECSVCPLNESTKVSSFITNEAKVDIVIVGQSPGFNEIKEGRPFVGKSGQLVNPVISNYSDSVIYINVMSCRPVDKEGYDRAPLVSEIKPCRGRFATELQHAASLKPKVVMVFGAVAKKEVTKVLEKDYNIFGGAPIKFLEHPSSILRRENRVISDRYTSEIHNICKSVFQSKEDKLVDSFITYNDSMSNDFRSECLSSGQVGVDIETSCLEIFDFNKFYIGCVAVSCNDHTYWFDFRSSNFSECADIVWLLENNSVRKVFANILFDVVSFEFYGVKVNNYTDLLPLAFIYDNSLEKNDYSLEAVASRFMPEVAGNYKSEFKSDLEDHNYLDQPTEKLMVYNCKDAFLTKELYSMIYKLADQDVRKIFDISTVRVFKVLVHMKIAGMRVDSSLVEFYSEIFKKRLQEIQDDFKRQYGVDNINSTPQIRKWMYDDLKLKPVKWTDPKTKATPSTDKEVIEIYKDVNPSMKLLYEARRLANLLSYFLPSFSGGLDQLGVCHPNFKHVGVATFRLSCNSPNILGIPRDKTNIEILDKNPLRRIFVAKYDDSYIVDNDFSQQEVRIIAELSGDKKLKEAFSNGLDIHKFVGSMVFKKPIGEVTNFERQIAKGCVFGSIFGVSVKEFAFKNRISESEAREHLDAFFNMFPGVKDYIERQHRIVDRNGVIKTVLGRPRKFVLDKRMVDNIHREAANFTIQAVGTDISFISLIGMYEEFEKSGLLNNGIQIINFVYDSIMLDVKSEHLKYAIETSTSIMRNVPKTLGFKIPFEVDTKVGKRWNESISKEDLDKIIN